MKKKGWDNEGDKRVFCMGWVFAIYFAFVFCVCI